MLLVPLVTKGRLSLLELCEFHAVLLGTLVSPGIPGAARYPLVLLGTPWYPLVSLGIPGLPGMAQTGAGLHRR